MHVIELQNEIVHKVLEVRDVDILNRLKALLYTIDNEYVLSDLEKRVLANRRADKTSKKTENHNFFSEIEQWMQEK